MRTRRQMHPLALLLALSLVAPATGRRVAEAQAPELTSPEQFFGFQMGADRKLARWDKLVEYYRLLERQSDRLQVVDMGPSTMPRTSSSSAGCPGRTR